MVGKGSAASISVDGGGNDEQREKEGNNNNENNKKEKGTVWDGIREKVRFCWGGKKKKKT